jgi:hypothetical protein
MDSQKIYLLAELTVLPEFLDDVKGALKQALIPHDQVECTLAVTRLNEYSHAAETQAVAR